MSLGLSVVSTSLLQFPNFITGMILFPKILFLAGIFAPTMMHDALQLCQNDCISVTTYCDGKLGYVWTGVELTEPHTPLGIIACNMANRVCRAGCLLVGKESRKDREPECEKEN